jgi:hypothetical protein
VSDEEDPRPQTDRSETNSGVPEEPGLREVSEEELKEILEEHREWLQSSGNEGYRRSIAERLESIGPI